MKRFSLLTLGLISLFWTTGCCCCWRHSQCCEWEDDACVVGQEGGECCGGGPVVESDDCDRCERCGRRHRRRRARQMARERARCAPANCCPANCCDPCASVIPSGGTVVGATSAPVVGSYEPDVMFGGPAGCAGCAGGGHSMSSLPATGGCASGNCGSATPTYGNFGSFPVDSSGGWTIQSTPMPGSSEPVQAPPASGSSANRSVVPSPSPLAPISATTGSR